MNTDSVADVSTVSNAVLEGARYYASRGWYIVPCVVIKPDGPKAKKQANFPFGWSESPTTDLEQIEKWFGPEGEAARPWQGIAINTGKKSGVIVVDIDNDWLWDQILAEGDERTVPDTYTVKSQSGNRQLYFAWPEGFAGNLGKKLTDYSPNYYKDDGRSHGIDILEEGNVVFAPPTQVHNQDGAVVGQYEVQPGTYELAVLPQWILDMYVAHSKTRRVSSATGSVDRPKIEKKDWPKTWDESLAQGQLDRILDWCRNEFERLQATADSWWDNGTARVMGVLVRAVNAPWFSFSESDLDTFLSHHAPEDDGFGDTDHQRIKHSIFKTADGDVIMYDPDNPDWDKFAANMLRGIAEVKEETVETPTQVQERLLLPNLPDDFWSRRPFLASIRRNAHFRGTSADAVLHSFFAAYAARVPYNYCVETGIGHPANIVYFTALIGNSGGGKGQSSSRGVSLSLNTLDEKPLGSGEGIAEFFLDSVVDEDDPKNYREDKKSGELVLIANPTKKKVMARHNLLIVESEGTNLATLTGRSGATLKGSLLKLGMGETLGNMNAYQESNRQVPGDAYSCGLIGGFQTQAAGELLAETDSGLAQRFLWASVLDRNIVKGDPPMPPDFNEPIPVPATSKGPIAIHVEETIIERMEKYHFAVQRGEIERDPFESHRPVRMLQLAAIIRMIDGPNLNDGTAYIITEEDWAISNIIYDTSSQVRRAAIERVEAQRDANLEVEGENVAKRQFATEVAKVTLQDNKYQMKVMNNLNKVIAEGKTPTILNVLRTWKNNPNVRRFVQDTILPSMVESGMIYFAGTEEIRPVKK